MTGLSLRYDKFIGTLILLAVCGRFFGILTTSIVMVFGLRPERLLPRQNWLKELN